MALILLTLIAFMAYTLLSRLISKKRDDNGIRKNDIPCD